METESFQTAFVFLGFLPIYKRGAVFGFYPTLTLSVQGEGTLVTTGFSLRHPLYTEDRSVL